MSAKDADYLIPHMLDAMWLIGARNDNLSSVEKEYNINRAWHVLNEAVSSARLEPSAHNGLVAGSNPAPPTIPETEEELAGHRGIK